MGTDNKFLATKFEIPKPNFNLHLPTRISKYTTIFCMNVNGNGDVRPGQFLPDVSATPILLMGSVMGLSFPLVNGTFLMTLLVKFWLP